MNRRIGFSGMALVSLAVGVWMAPSIYANPFKSKKSASNAKDDADVDFGDYDAEAKVPLVGDYTQVMGQNYIVLRGAGLVVDLDGTGEDAPPSRYRDAVIEDMKKHNVPHPNKWLKSPNVAVVALRAFLPPLVRKGDHFDVEVSVPPGSKVKSLNGGRLMRTYLTNEEMVPGVGLFNGRQMATVEGSILVSSAHQNARDLAGVLRRGRIVAGGTSLVDRNLDLYLRNDVRSVRMSTRIADAIGRRFFEYDKYGQQVALAKPETDQRIELKVLSKYRDNYPRYLDVIRKIPFREDEVSRQVRLRALRSQLLRPDTAGVAALKLEAIGDAAVPVLKAGVQSKIDEVRYHSAIALAYMGNSFGLDVLADAARNEYAFRAFALAAMSCLDDPEVHVKLRDLMGTDSAETRYGAFRALTTLDKNDPFVRGTPIRDQFTLHVLSTAGPPMVHITNCRKSEIVIFGADQELRTPLFARAGTRILVTAPAGSRTVKVSRFEVGRDDQIKLVSTRLNDIVRAISELEATFPDVAQFLAECDAQKNLAGRLEIDALPRAGRFYERKGTEVASKAATRNARRRVGNDNMIPNLFSTGHDKSPSKKGGDADHPDAPAPDADLNDQPARARQPADNEDSDSVIAAGHKVGNAAKPQRVTRASLEKPDDATSPSDTELLDAPDRPDTSPTRFGFWRWFNFGDRGVSGNKEP